MTPFGEKLRALRSERGWTQKHLATMLGISPAYLSALEHGQRGAPSFEILQLSIQAFGLIWDEAEELIQAAQLSHPKVTIDTSGLDARATQLANILAQSIHRIDNEKLDALLKLVEDSTQR